jgi:hypothetical protein
MVQLGRAGVQIGTNLPADLRTNRAARAYVNKFAASIPRSGRGCLHGRTSPTIEAATPRCRFDAPSIRAGPSNPPCTDRIQTICLLPCSLHSRREAIRLVLQSFRPSGSWSAAFRGSRALVSIVAGSRRASPRHLRCWEVGSHPRGRRETVPDVRAGRPCGMARPSRGLHR